MGKLPTGKYYKKHLLSRDDNRVNLRIRPQTEVSQIVDFEQGVYRVIRPILMFYGYKISLMNNDAKYQTTQQMREIADLIIREYAYSKAEINNIFSGINTYARNENTKMDNELTKLENEINNLYDDYIKIIDANDLVNVSPKIGLFQEDIMNVTSKFKINYICGKGGYSDMKKRVPVITSDNTGRQVMYYLGNDGSYNREEIDNLRKAYRIDNSSPWVYNNNDIIPYCFKDRDYKIKTIWGCDNEYLIVQLTDSTYWLIHTDFSYDENDWKIADDITSMVTNTTNDLLLHIKYIKDYNTLIVITGLPKNYTDKYWYRVRVFNYSTKQLLRTDDLIGGGYFIKLTDNYSFSNERLVTCGLDLTESEISNFGKYPAYSGTYEDSHSASVLLYEQQETLVIICAHTNGYVFSAKKNSDDTYTFGSKAYHDAGILPFIYNFPVQIAMGNNEKLSNGEYKYKITEKLGKGVITNPSGGEYINKLSENVGNSLNNTSDSVNNSSYDTLNGTSFRSCGVFSSNCWFKYNEYRFSDVILPNTNYNGLKIKYYSGQLYTPDTAIWGKNILLGTVLWDTIFISCMNSKGSHLVWIDKWRFVKGYENELVIEPQPGKYVEIDKTKFTDVLTTVTTGTNKQFKTNNPKAYVNAFTFPTGITSVKNTDGSAAYYSAEYCNGKIYARKFEKNAVYENGKPKSFTITANPIDPLEVTIPKSKFNFGDDRTFIYEGFVIYNPLANMYFMFATLDEGNIEDNDNMGLTHIIGIKPNKTIISYGEPKNKKWDYGGVTRKVNSYSTNTYYTPYIPDGCTIIDKYNMMVFFRELHSGGRSSCRVLYTFTDNTYTDFNISYVAGTPDNIYWAPVGLSLGTMQDQTILYAGPKLGFAGQGNVRGGDNFGNSWYNTYKIDIRTQKPLLGTNTNETTYDEMDSAKSANTTNNNTYTMFMQSATGLMCMVPSGHYLLGGYWSTLVDPIEVELYPNMNANTPGSVLGYKDANYIYLERDPNDRHNLIASCSKQRIIYESNPMFNKILVAKIETDEEKPINTMVYYRNNIGYNKYSFFN
jgi:hypothetical protein